MKKNYKIFAMKTKPGNGEQNYSFSISANSIKESFEKAKEKLSTEYEVDYSCYHIDSEEK